MAENGEIIRTYPMPIIKGKRKEYDVQGICNIFFEIIEQFENPEMIAFLEKSLVLPISGRMSVASTSRCQGIFLGILSALKIPHQVIRAKDWQKVVLKGFNQADTKTASILFCQRRYPKADLRASERARKPSDGITDSICISYYSWLKHNSSILSQK